MPNPALREGVLPEIQLASHSQWGLKHFYHSWVKELTEKEEEDGTDLWDAPQCPG